jgi:hypothetical protein
MYTITVSDRRPNRVLAFDLRELLSLIRDDARRMEWSVADLECIGASASELENLTLPGARVHGDVLLALAEGIEQVIDGEFCAYEPGNSSPIYLLRAVDSSSWDIAADRDELLDVFRKRFTAVVEAGDAY